MDPHHHHHLLCHQTHHPPSSATCHYSATCCYSASPPTDPLLHPPPPPSYYYYTPNPSTPINSPSYPPKHEQFQYYPSYQTHPDHHQPTTTVSSLLRRIAALESSLRHHLPASSVRDAAARTIQTYFRVFLVRRSRTLRHLKDLAFIKSSLNSLKSSSTRVDPRSLSGKAMDLLLRIDSIQGGDSMIRDGKKAIRGDLVRFLGLIDRLPAKRSKLSSIGVKNLRTRVLYNEEDLNEKMRARVNGFSHVQEDDDDYEDEEEVELENFRIIRDGKIGSLRKRNEEFTKRHSGDQGNVKKTVRFAENGNVYRTCSSTKDLSSSEEGSVYEEEELVENLCSQVRKSGPISKENEDEEEEESSQISNGEVNPKRGLRIESEHRGGNGDFTFCAPMPVKTEMGADLMKNRKALKIVE